MPQLEQTTVVITGASSGIGRATARAFAARGANLVLAARRDDLLEEVARECRQEGVQAVPVETDVADLHQMNRLARTAVERFGGIDVWVNNAGVGAVGRFEETPMAAHRRVIETDLMGPMHGAYVALPHMQRQRHGVLINTVSLGAFAAPPFAAAYAAAKFGLRGFIDSLRQELRDWPDVHVCGVYPSFVDTPGIAHGANYTGHQLRPKGPALTPEHVAAAIVRCAEHPRREVLVGGMTRVAKVAHALVPGLVERIGPRLFGGAIARAPRGPVHDGTLFHPMWSGRGVSGGLNAGLGWVKPAAVATALGMTALGVAVASARIRRK
ncbi:MAG TPA: SDR family oxidoreductase [Azospirillaceae bacterium]|nr:SDR family oxidoreductase [Azospirillaceae bacterium]